MSKMELDDQIMDHPKFVRAAQMTGGDAWFLWCGLRSYCAKMLTDGYIPDHMVYEVRGPASKSKRKNAFSALFTVGLLDKADGGVILHDYLHWASSKSQILAWREANAARKRQSRATSRCDSAVSHTGVTPESHPESHPESQDGHTGSPSGIPEPSPSPSPSPSLISDQISDLKNPHSPQGGSKRKTRDRSSETICPESLVPTDATLAVADEMRTDWSKHFAQMHDWSVGKNMRRADWQASLRNWMRSNPGMYPLAIAIQASKPKSVDASTLGVTL